MSGDGDRTDCDGEESTETATEQSSPANGIDAHRPVPAVRDVYDEIASHFAETRHAPWPEVTDFLADCDPPVAARGLDLGCGNGRHTAHLAAVVDYAVGLDVSRELLGEAVERVVRTGKQTGPATGSGTNDGHIALLQGHAGAIPLQDGTVDVGLYVATLHHLPDREARVESLAELARVLSAGGVALVSAWSTAHDRFEATASEDGTGFDTTIDWTLPGGETVPRFYHIYAQAEFEADLCAAGLAVESSVISNGNCYGRVRPA